MNAALVVELILNAANILKYAKSEGRDVTNEELDLLASTDDASRKKLQDLINRKRGTT